jgi:outer membrane lipoprotein SlyB
LLIALCFTACETTTAGPNQQRTAAQGAATGAILGAIIGNQSDSDNGSNRGAVIGAISGAIIGSNIGEAKDKEIQEYRESQIKLAEAQRKAAIANGSNITDSELEVARIKAATAEAELNKLKKENAENIKRARELAALREREQRAREELEALSAD